MVEVIERKTKTMINFAIIKTLFRMILSILNRLGEKNMGIQAIYVLDRQTHHPPDNHL